MLQFHPAGMSQQVVQTNLGSMVYYTPAATAVPGAAPLLFLHGFGGGASAYEWSKVYPAFLESHAVLVPDLIGWGESAHPVHDYQVSDYLDTLYQFIQQTCSTPVTVVAASLTGAIAVRLAIQHPDLFQSLLLICPSGFADFGQDSGRRLPLSMVSTPFLSDLIYTLGATNPLAVRNFLERFLFANPSLISPEMVDAYLTSAQKNNAQYAALAFLQGSLYFDLAAYLGQLTVPTTLIWGAKAQFTPATLGQRLASLNPDAIRSFIELPNVGVLPHLEQPASVIGILQSVQNLVDF